MKGFKDIIDVGRDFLRIEFPPKNEKVRNEFLDESMKKKAIYEDVTLKYKDPEKTKLHIRNKIREMKYTVLHGELDHWEVQFGKGPMFRQVDSKSFVLSFKGTKAHNSSKTLGYIIMGIGILTFIFGLMSQGFAGIVIGFILLISLITLGWWIGKSLTLWIKGTGVAHRLKGYDIFSDQYFQFSAECGFQGMGKMNILREDFDRIFKEIIEFLGEVTEKTK